MKHFPKRFRTACLIAASSMALAACMGGGGGGGGGSPAVAAAAAAASASAASGSGVLLQWDAPSENTDGSALRDTTGYRLNYGSAPGSYTASKNVDLNDVDCTIGEDQARYCSYRLAGLDKGTWYVTVQAADSDGRFSAHSEPLTVKVEQE